MFHRDPNGAVTCYPKLTINSLTAESILKARDLISVITREHSIDFLVNGKHIKIVQEECEKIMTEFIAVFFPTPETKCKYSLYVGRLLLFK